MNTSQPITTAVYGKQRGGKKPARKPEQPRRAERQVSRIIGDELVAELYRNLGFKQPSQRRRRPRK